MLETMSHGAVGAGAKAASAFRTISEVAAHLEVPQHVLRFWESKFQQVRPVKRGGGRRYYRPEDETLLASIKDLLYNQGLTIRGVQKLLKETGRGGIVRPSVLAAAAAPVSVPFLHQDAAQADGAEAPATVLSWAKRREIEGVLGELKAMREMLGQLGV